MRRLFMTSVAVAVLGVPVSAQTEPSSDTGLAQQVVREIAQIKGGTTPEQWLQVHPDEKLQMFNGAQYANDTQRWCARTVVTHSATTGRAWTRSVYFYDPQPPDDDALPAQGTSPGAVVETTCQLGLMWIDVPEGNLAVGTKLTEAIQATVLSHYGVGSVPRLGPDGFGAVGWKGTQQWNVDGAVLTVAYDQFRGARHRVLVRLAFANSDAIHDLVKDTEQVHIDLMARRDELIGKVKEAGMPVATTTKMTALLEKPDYFSGQNRPSDTEVLAAFRDWLRPQSHNRPRSRQ